MEFQKIKKEERDGISKGKVKICTLPHHALGETLIL